MAESESALPAGLDEDRLAGLYAAPLEEFVTRRKELAGELQRAGAKDAAAWVKTLPKPVATAWALNRLAAERRAALDELRARGDALRHAQAAGDRERMRRVADERRAEVEALVEAAGEILRAGGHQPSVQALQRVRRSLDALAAYGTRIPLDPPLGRMHADLEPPGFETLLGLPLAPAPPRPAREAPPPRARKGDDERTSAAAKARAAKRLELQRAATAAAARVEEARLAAREAESARERAAGRVEDAERALARQEERLREARATRDRAVAEGKAAERDAANAAKALAKARAELAGAQKKLKELA